MNTNCSFKQNRKKKEKKKEKTKRKEKKQKQQQMFRGGEESRQQVGWLGRYVFKNHIKL